MKVCLVASAGGHLMELMRVRQAWQEHERIWVTFPTDDARVHMQDERVVWAHYPTNRNVPNLLRNVRLAWKTLHRDRPDVIISTGAGVAVPFIWVGWTMNIPTIFIESLTFIDERSLSAKLVYRCVDYYYVQWPELAEKYSKAIYRGQVL